MVLVSLGEPLNGSPDHLNSTLLPHLFCAEVAVASSPIPVSRGWFRIQTHKYSKVLCNTVKDVTTVRRERGEFVIKVQTLPKHLLTVTSTVGRSLLSLRMAQLGTPTVLALPLHWSQITEYQHTDRLCSVHRRSGRGGVREERGRGKEKWGKST